MYQRFYEWTFDGAIKAEARCFDAEREEMRNAVSEAENSTALIGAESLLRPDRLQLRDVRS
jgi:hypothetical protein